MGTKYYRCFTPFLELFEPPAAYLSELRLQHAWKHDLWNKLYTAKDGRSLKIVSVGHHNHSDGPDFLGSQILLGGKLLTGDIELHHRAKDWYAHGHHLDAKYNRCILHVVFHSSGGNVDAKCLSGKTLPECYIPIEDVLGLEPPGSCRIFKPDDTVYFSTLQKYGWERVKEKIRYYFDNRLRFPNDVMLYWGLFKAAGYRYNEENMIRLFVQFPWAAFSDILLDRKDIVPMLAELAGFSPKQKDTNVIPWTFSRTRPGHFPENRVKWLGGLMEYYYGTSLSDVIYDILESTKDLSKVKSILFKNEDVHGAPGQMIQQEIMLNTILPLAEAMRREKKQSGSLGGFIRQCYLDVRIPAPYGCVRRFHEKHGINENDSRQKNWLAGQGVLFIKDHYCSQGMQLVCPICLMEEWR